MPWSKYCIFKGLCKKPQSIKDPFYKLWITVEKTSKIISCHCIYMAVVRETCNHVAAVIYWIEASVRLGLTNLACLSNVNEWLWNQKSVEPKKIKNVPKFQLWNLWTGREKKRPLVASLKKKFDLLKKHNLKPLSVNNLA